MALTFDTDIPLRVGQLVTVNDDKGVTKPARIPAMVLSDSTGAVIDIASGAIDDPNYVKAAPYTFLGDQQIVSATLAASTALTVPAGATVATIQNNSTGVCRWRNSGTPTASLGQTIAAGGTLTLDAGNAGLTSTRFIIGSGTVILDINYYS